jgi:hypothetical protein
MAKGPNQYTARVERRIAQTRMARDQIVQRIVAAAVAGDVPSKLNDYMFFCAACHAHFSGEKRYEAPDLLALPCKLVDVDLCANCFINHSLVPLLQYVTLGLGSVA